MVQLLLSVLWIIWQVPSMTDYGIQKIFQFSYDDYQRKTCFQSDVQRKAARAILNCKTGKLGMNFSRCDDCGHISAHHNSCRNRNCPNCQAVSKEIWVDRRRSEVMDAPYYHVVFTLPHELNSLIYCNQTLLYNLLHRCCAETLLELASDKKWLGATPGIIQVLHTWNQELDYHVHMHCIVSGGGITRDLKLRKSKGKFFIPVFVLRDKFKGKYMACLKKLYTADSFSFSKSCSDLQDAGNWNTFCHSLYNKDWCPYIKETFHGFGNALEYLGKYTHKIAISNRRIISVDRQNTIFSARGKKPGEARRTITLANSEFIRRYLMHVLPSGFQKIRYYGFLNNRMKSVNLKLIFKLQGYQKFRQRYAGMSMTELLKAVWKFDICLCPECRHASMRPLGRRYVPSG